MRSAPSYIRKFWHYRCANTQIIRRTVSEFSWHDHLNNHDPNWQVEFFNNTILNVMSNFIPNYYRKIQPKDPPWITTEINRLIKKQNRFYKNFQRKGCKPHDQEAVDNFRNECCNAINITKENYLTNLGKQLNDPKTGTKAYWKDLNKLLNKSNIPIIPPTLYSNKFITSFVEKANLINESNLMNALNPNKSHGPDNISILMLLICGDPILVPLDLIFLNIVQTCTYPDQWKHANVTPVHKKVDKQKIKNYRPISLLPIWAKLFERILFNNIYNYLISNNLITTNQSGLKPGDSTTNQLLYLTHIIHSSFDLNMSREDRHVFLVMTKAFDKVWHEGLVFKLKQNGISGQILNLLTSYLDKRKQRVLLNGCESHWAIVGSGVPQRSVLGPLLFLFTSMILRKELNLKSIVLLMTLLYFLQ